DGTLRLGGLCLDTAGGATAPRTPAELDTCQSGRATQQWSQGSGNTLVTKGGGRCLEDPGGATAPRTQLDIAACTGLPPPVWPLPAAQAPPSGPPVGPVYPQEKQVDANVPCLDDAGHNLAAGTKVELWTCRGNAEQQWTMAADGTIQ